MSDTTFVDKSHPLIGATWLNEINGHVHNDTLIAGKTHLHAAEKISFTPTGSVAATNVQAAIVELDTAIVGLDASKAVAGANSDITQLTGMIVPLTVSQGGMGAATHTANAVLLGNGTSAVQAVAPGASGNLLTSNGTTWQSTAPAATGLGIGQTWQDMTGSRSIGPTFQNLTGRVIAISVIVNGDGYILTGSASPPTRVASQFDSDYSAPSNVYTHQVLVLPNEYYKAVSTNSMSLSTWLELR